MHRRAQGRVARADDRELLASAAHELKTPIAAVRGAATALRRDWDGIAPIDRERLLAVIASAGDQLARLADDLLAYARGSAAGAAVEIVPCDIATIVGTAVDAARAASTDASITLETESDLPLALADPGRLQQVAANLIQNALRHGGGAADVSVTSGEGSLRVEVADRGPGVAPEDRERVFRPFERLPGAAPGGAGLGLYLARELTEAMHGRLVLSDREGGGTVFAVELPQAAEA
jgi:two-component system sensor histidine kinase KdpD